VTTTNKEAHMPARKQLVKDRPLFVRLTHLERLAIEEAARASLDERGRPMTASSWSRRVLMAAALKENP
jgi:hypothetical protein